MTMLNLTMLIVPGYLGFSGHSIFWCALMAYLAPIPAMTLADSEARGEPHLETTFHFTTFFYLVLMIAIYGGGRLLAGFV